jgi:hypothetical protein
MKIRNRVINLILSVIIAFSFLLLGLVRSEQVLWPDAVHTNYGFPLFWLTHQTSSFSGPVDIWQVRPLDFIVNLFFLFSITFLMLWILKKHRISPRR